jgi:protein SCO1/2
MRRRAYLASVSTLASAGAAGCFGLGDANPDVVLEKPDRAFESADVVYPAWGQPVPDAVLPAPLDGDEVDLAAVEKPTLLTFFYSYCRTVCPVLISTLRNVQRHAIDNDYADAVTFAPTTFDPGRDDAARLRAYADRMNVDADAGNWHFLRPESKTRAKAVITDEFGVAFERIEPPADSDVEYMFNHTALTLLVNGSGYVERAYQTKQPDEQAIVEDLRRVRTA